MADAQAEGLVAVESDDEFAQLADAINNMLEKRRATELALRDLAHRDPLTRLPNRVLFRERLVDMIEHARRVERQVAVYVMDLDNFKDLNDTIGHIAGDDLLRQVADRLEALSRETDIVARLGGDEFAIIQTNINHPDGVMTFAQRIVDGLTEPYSVADTTLHSTTSLGITIFPDDDDDADQLLKNAELALYQAKQEGRGHYQLFDAEMHEVVQHRHALERQLRQAIDENAFEVHFQPRYRLNDQVIVGAEALVRWRHPERGYISPAEFIPVAESSGVITRITEIVLAAACQRAAIWSAGRAHPFTISVNLSPVDFRRGDIAEVIDRTLNAVGLDPSSLEIEITEGIVMYGADLVRDRLADIRELGVSLAIDDFGTGYSSMNYLKSFPVDTLKIDKTFVAGIPANREDISITMAIIRLAHSLGLTIIAEGVETQAQMDFLARRNCDQVQGYLLSPAIAADEFSALLSREAQPVEKAANNLSGVAGASCLKLRRRVVQFAAFGRRLRPIAAGLRPDRGRPTGCWPG